MAKGTRNQKGAAYARLLLVLVFAFAVIVLFREQIGKLLGDAGEVNLNVNEFGIKIKTKDTPLGKVDVSVPPASSVKAPAAEGVSGNSYVSQNYRFQISWPEGGWKPVLGVPFSRRHELGLSNFGGALPVEITNASDWVVFPVGVVVGVSPAANKSIQAYVGEAVEAMRARGWAASPEIDSETKSALIVFEGGDPKQVELRKIVFTGDRVYMLTTGPMADQVVANTKAKLDVAYILNSFKVF